MAIQVAYQDPGSRLNLPVAYVRVLAIHIDALAATIEVKLGIYPDAASRAAGGTPLLTYSGWPPFSAITGGPIDIVAASYGFVKTLPVFAGAIDVV